MAAGTADRQTGAQKPAQPRLADLQAAFKDAGRGKPCARCGSRRRVQQHHVLRRQDVRRLAKAAGVDVEQAEWDPRNGLPVCKVCHDSHHSRRNPIPRAVVVEKAPRALEFARELGQAALEMIKRDYPSPA